MNSGVYKIENLVDGKFYIGSSIGLKVRLRTHLLNLRKSKHDNEYLQRAFNKHGEENFVFSIMLICDKSQTMFYEQLLIDGYRAADRKFGYNICPKADSTVGRVFSDKALANIRSRKKRETLTEEHRKKISESLAGNTRRVGHKHSEERKQQISNFFRGRKFSAETIQKMNAGRERTRMLKQQNTVT